MGVLGLLGALFVYAIAVATIVPPLIGSWHTLAQTLIYIVLGVVWLLPMRGFLMWMETGHWRVPRD